MADITNILYEYGNACRYDYPQGDSVEDAMNTIIQFCSQHGYEFSKDEANELRNALYMCPLGIGIFQGTYSCEECPHSYVKSGFINITTCELAKDL